MSLPLPDSFNTLLTEAECTQIDQTLLTEAECTQIDQTLLPTRERFSIRLKIYAARYLTQIAQRSDTSVGQLTPEQISTQLRLDPKLQQENEFEGSFVEWFENLLIASLKPLAQIATDTGETIENISLSHVIEWHRQQLNAKLP